MGLSETVTSLILVKSDSSQAKSDLRSLRGAEKAAAKERLTEIEATNKGIDAQIAKWAKIAAGVGMAVGAFKLAQGAANAYLEDLRLESAAAGVDMAKLETATRKLVEADNLLAFAGKAQHGVWKLNQQEMELVAKGTDVLAKRMGLELQPAMERVTEAVSKGQTRALKELGIEVKDKAGLMREMTAAAKDWGKAGTTEGEKWIQAQNTLRNAWDDMQGAIGEMVIALTPLVALIGDLAAKIQSVADKLGGPSRLYSFLMGGGGGVSPEMQANIKMLQERERATLPNGGRTLIRAGSGATDAEAKAATDALDLLTTIGKNMARAKSAGSGYRAANVNAAVSGGDPTAAFTGLGGGASGLGSAFGNTFAAANAQRGFSDLGGHTIGLNNELQVGAYGSQIESARIELEKMVQVIVENDLHKRSLMETIFGTPQVIDQIGAAVYGAASAFRLLEGAAVAALDAFITGQQSMADAVKAAIAQGLKAVAIDAGIQALKNTAYGFAALATGPIGGVSAGGFFKAAALFAGVSAAATLGARSAYSAGWAGGGGGGGGGPSGTSAGGYIGGGAGGRGGSQTTSTVIYVTGDAYRMSQAEREHRISDAARRGQQKRTRNVVRHE